MINQILKKRLKLKLDKTSMSDLDNIITDVKLSQFKEHDLLFLDTSNAKMPIGFSYDRLIFFKETELEYLYFHLIERVELPNHMIFDKRHETLNEAKSSQNVIVFHMIDGAKKEIEVSKNGTVFTYKSLIDLAIFIIKKQKVE